MIKVALKGLAGRKVRALLTALAVVIGVSMVSGTFVLTDTMQKAFDGIFQESYEGTDAVISGGPVPASLLEKVKGLPSVETAAGSIQDLQENTNPATLLDKDGEMIGRQGESMGIGVGDDGRQFTPLKLKQGGWAHGAKQVVLDAGTARKYDFAVGDKIKIAGNGPAQDYTVQGVATFGSIDNLGGTSLAIFDVGTAQALFDKAGQFDSVSVKAKDGSSPEARHQGHQAAAGQGPRRPDRRRAGQGGRQGHQREPEVHHVLPARLRRHRAVRGRVRDPQHALDHRRPALARVRDAAHPRRLAASGHALGDHRGPDRRPRSPPCWASCSGSASPRP